MSVKLHSSFLFSVRSISLRSGCESTRSTPETSSELADAIFKTLSIGFAFHCAKLAL